MSHKALTCLSCRDNTGVRRRNSNDGKIVTTLVFYSCVLIEVCLDGETDLYLSGRLYNGMLDLHCNISYTAAFRNIFLRINKNRKRCCNYLSYSIISKPQPRSVVCYCLSSKRHLELDAFGKTRASSDISEPPGILPGSQLPLQTGTAPPSVECHICWARAASWIPRGLSDGSRHC